MKDVEIKCLLKAVLTGKINDRELFMKGIDISYYYEGYSEYRVEDLQHAPVGFKNLPWFELLAGSVILLFDCNRSRSLGYVRN